jgi:hypothetical protein
VAFNTTISPYTQTSTSNGVWRIWTQNYSTTAITQTFNSAVWSQWTGSVTNTTTGSTILNYTWNNWNGTYATSPIQVAQHMPARRAPTQAEMLAAKVAEDKRVAEWREWRERETKRVAEADRVKRRAEDLLRSHLTEQQQQDLDKSNCFYLESVGKEGERRRYRIDRGTHGNVKLLDAKGSIIGRYCVQPNGVPAEDAMLAQKLWLETDEEAFKKVANFTRY